MTVPDVLVKGTAGPIAEIRTCGCWVVFLAATTAVATCERHREDVMRVIACTCPKGSIAHFKDCPSLDGQPTPPEGS